MHIVVQEQITYTYLLLCLFAGGGVGRQSSYASQTLIAIADKLSCLDTAPQCANITSITEYYIGLYSVGGFQKP